MARNNNSVLCARTLLISPQEQHRRVTHHLKVAVVEGDGGNPIYHFPNEATTTTSDTITSNNPTNTTNNTNANLTNINRDSDGNGCGRSVRKALRRFFVKNGKLDGDLDDVLIGDGRLTKEARPAHKAPLSLWKIVPIDKINTGEEDCIELRVTLTVFGCDVEETRL